MPLVDFFTTLITITCSLKFIFILPGNDPGVSFESFWAIFPTYVSKILIDTCWFWIFFYQFAKILCQLSTYIAETYSQHLVLSLVGDDLNYSLLLIIRLSEVWMLPSLWIVCLSVEVEIVGTILNIIYLFLWRSQQQAIFYSMIGFTIFNYKTEPSLHFLRMFETLSIASLVLPKQLYALGGCHVVQLMNSSYFLRDYLLWWKCGMCNCNLLEQTLLN